MRNFVFLLFVIEICIKWKKVKSQSNEKGKKIDFYNLTENFKGKCAIIKNERVCTVILFLL